MPIALRAPENEAEFAKYYDLRWRILRQPWSGEKPTGEDQFERTATHLTAWDGDRLVGCGRIHMGSAGEAQIRGMAVEQGYQNRGIGSRILQALEQRASQAGARRVVLHARESALEFYRKNQYQVAGPSYTLFHSIVHWRMCKDLS